MKKRALTLTLAAAMVFSSAVSGIAVSAYDGQAIPYTYYRYASDKVYGDSSFWYPNLDAYYQFNTMEPMYVREPARAYTEDRFCYFDSTTGTYVDSGNTFNPNVYKITRNQTQNTGREYTSYLAGDGFYYPSLQLARNHTPARQTSIGSVIKKGDGIYFAVTSGNFYPTYSEALAATNGNASYIMLEIGGQYYDYTNTPVYKNSVTGKYYLSAEEAADANIKGNVLPGATPTQGYYFNRTTGRFYATREAALAATNINDVIKATSLAYSNGIYNYYDTDSGEVPYYYDGIYNPNYTGTDNASAKNGDAYIYGNVTYAGWSKILDYINNRGKGAVVNVNMNEQVVIPKGFMEGLAKKQVNVVFINPNGSRITLNGADITTPKAADINVTYSTTNIPASAVKNLRVGAISSSQFTIGDGSVYGFSATVAVNFNKERAGKTIKLYYYDTLTKKTSFVDSAKVASNGRATFRINRGGDYCAVIME
jgi:hypothetical protein